MSDFSPLEVFDRRESEVRGYIRSFPVVFDRASGSTLVTADGDEYLDFFAGAGTARVAATSLGRSFVLVDQNPQAIDVMRSRLPEAEFLDWSDR